MTRILFIAAVLLPLVGLTVSAHADIYQWEYINPADRSQVKRQSTTLAPDGAGVDALPEAAVPEPFKFALAILAPASLIHCRRKNR